MLPSFTEFANRPLKKSKELAKELAKITYEPDGDDSFIQEDEPIDNSEQELEGDSNDDDSTEFGEDSEGDENQDLENLSDNDPLAELRKLQEPAGSDGEDEEAEEENSDIDFEVSKKSLFPQDSDLDQEEEELQQTVLRLSSYQRQKRKLETEARALEEENVAEKNWTLKGQVSAKLRPENSLLEEDLEFDFQSIPAPVITTETTNSIEDIVKRRIKDQAFDNPVPPVEEDLKDQATLLKEKRQKIALEMQERTDLGSLYEKDFLRAKGDLAADSTDTLDPKLKAKYQELNALYEKITSTIDNLLFHSSNFAICTHK